jgi:hypothetical protein
MEALDRVLLAHTLSIGLRGRPAPPPERGDV